MIKEAIGQIVGGHSLTMDESSTVMNEIMEGTATPAQFGAFVTALRFKGETVEEIAGLARTMRGKSLRVRIAEPVVDTCGTGGDGKGTFNISTTAAFVAAACGLKVAKHGNRAMSSQCGSADVLEALGVKIDLNPEQVQRCLETVGIGFMLAPVFHPAMKYAAGPRKEVGIRTVFNILGPLTNPAGAGTFIAELKNGAIIYYEITPTEFGLQLASPESLKGGSVKDNAELLRGILSGKQGPQRDIVLMNTAAALIAGDKVTAFGDGIIMAGVAIDSGRALQKVEELIKFSQNAG